MKFGVREICDVVLKAKTAQKIGKKIFYAGEPVCYFDTLKTSSMEGAATTVYAQGGRGNARLMAWEGERTVTFTMEDALISPEGFMILSGAGIVDAEEKTIYQHITETVDSRDVEEETKYATNENGQMIDSTGAVTDDVNNAAIVKTGNLIVHTKEVPYLPAGEKDNFAYVMLVKNGVIVSEPLIPVHGEDQKQIVLNASGVNYVDGKTTYTFDISKIDYDSVIVDYYTARTSNARQIEITADKFGGNYYLEASTLFRDTNGVDMPAEFIIPNCKVQSNFTFTMASSGDPSSFTFTMDAFPDYTRFDKSKKVLAAIQIIEKGGSQQIIRNKTAHDTTHDDLFI